MGEESELGAPIVPGDLANVLWTMPALCRVLFAEEQDVTVHTLLVGETDRTGTLLVARLVDPEPVRVRVLVVFIVLQTLLPLYAVLTVLVLHLRQTLSLPLVSHETAS